jgi:hypothetical protein
MVSPPVPGEKRTLVPQDWQGPPSCAVALHWKHSTLYLTSWRPPVSDGGSQCRESRVPDAEKLRFWGADGGPVGEKGPSVTASFVLTQAADPLLCLSPNP